MAQTGRRYIVSYYAERDRQCWPRYWSDSLCVALLRHARMLLEHGNPARFHLCCGLDEAIKRLDYDAMRYWISTHDEKVRQVIRYDIYIIE